MTLWFLQWLVGMMSWFEIARIFGWWSTGAVCPYLCAERDQCKGLGRILYTIGRIWLVIHCSAICPHLCIKRGRRWDRILYTHMSWLYIWCILALMLAAMCEHSHVYRSRTKTHDWSFHVLLQANRPSKSHLTKSNLWRRILERSRCSINLSLTKCNRCK